MFGHFNICRWYFGDLSAKEAEENLKRSENRNGSFLIRKEKDVLYLSGKSRSYVVKKLKRVILLK